MRHALRVLFAAALLACSSTLAIADVIGEVGTPVGLTVHTDDSDTYYLMFHGQLFLKQADGTVQAYRWGGVSCGTRLLDEAQIATVQGALDNNKMRLQPIYQVGQGDSRCLVGFTIVPKSAVKLVIP
jgi:hypothetical protein